MSEKKSKKGESDERVFLGRPGNNVKIGIVGMPNVGKSSLFNSMSKQAVPSENFPFCTIDPHVAKCPVPDKRFDFLVDFHKPKSVVPAVLTITDIAGLVKGASEGRGLGNAFLSHIAAVDAIFHVVRAFKSKDIEHVEGSVDGVRDVEIISTELRLKDIERVTNMADAKEKAMSRQKKDKETEFELATYAKVKELLESGKNVRHGEWTPKEAYFLSSQQFLTAKPVVYLINLSKKAYLQKKSAAMPKIVQWVKQNDPGAVCIPFSGSVEEEIAGLEGDAVQAYCEENKTQSMMDKIISTGYHTLDLVHFFTCGSDEVKCWTIRRGTKAPQAAGVIHSDFERGFIAAETMAFDDFKELGSEAAVKAAGKYRKEGKPYVVKDGDIIFFKFNVTAPAKKK